MGWNDTCKLVIIQIIVCLSFFTNLYGQEKGFQKENKLPPAYMLKAYFKTQIYYNYVLSDTTKVKRVYADSSTLEFQRIVSYYFTIMQPDPPKDGFSQVEVSIDSINYKFIEGKNVYEFSNIETSSPSVFNFEDFKTYSIPMSMQFEITYSPYGEVAKIDGERLREKRSYIEKLKASIPDSIWYYNWSDGLSDQRLKQICDVIKLTYPVNPVYRDSIWYSPIELQIDGINVHDTLELRTTGFFNNNYSIIGKFVNPQFQWKKTKFFKVNTLSLPYKLNSANGSVEQIVSASGLVQDFRININMDVQVGNPMIFNENLKKILKFEMVNSYRFK